MKLITTIVARERLDAIKEALRALGISDLIVTAVECHAAKTDHTETYKGATYAIDSAAKIKVETAVADELEAALVSVFYEAGETLAQTLIADVSPARSSQLLLSPRAA